MSYHIYSTRGLVLSERPWRESDRIYSILTRDLGLIRATALGVRKEESKLRGGLEPVTFSSISLVRGKEYWRATSVESIKSVSVSLPIARPLALLEKLVQGESPHPELFDMIESKLQSYSSDMIYHITRDHELFEIKLVSQILFHLGYLKESDLGLERKELIKVINEGIQASHL